MLGLTLNNGRRNRVNQSHPLKHPVLRILSFQYFQLCLSPKERALQFLPFVKLPWFPYNVCPAHFHSFKKDTKIALLLYWKMLTHWHTVLLLACTNWPSVLIETQTSCYPLVLLLSLLQQCQGEQMLCNWLSTANFILCLAMGTRSAKVAGPGLHYNARVCQLNFTV